MFYNLIARVIIIIIFEMIILASLAYILSHQ